MRDTRRALAAFVIFVSASFVATASGVSQIPHLQGLDTEAVCNTLDVSYGTDLCAQLGQSSSSAPVTSGSKSCAAYNLDDPQGSAEVINYLQAALYNDPVACFNSFVQSCKWHFETSAEQTQAFANWTANYQDLLEYLLGADAGVVGPDCLSILPYDEQLKWLTGYQGSTAEVGHCDELPDFDGSTPLSLDWTARGYVTPVTDQAGGTCYVHAAVNWFASQVLLLNLTDVSGKNTPSNRSIMSVQPVLDCLNPGAVSGLPCMGGHTAIAVALLGKNGVVPTTRYPYITRTYQQQNNLGTYDCSQPANPACATLESNTSHLYRLPQEMSQHRDCHLSQSQLVRLIADQGPVTMGLSVGALASKWKPYQDADKKVKMPWREDQALQSNMSYCAPDGSINHAVLLTGYDMTDPENPYFIYKNSWGTGYGASGYGWAGMSLLNSTDFYDRNFTGQCGITTSVSVWEQTEKIAAAAATSG